MKNTFFSMLLMVFVIPANAAVIGNLSSLDYSVAGDGLLTHDTSTGFNWLDLSVTAGNSIVDTEADSLIFSSFRWATESEISSLLDAVVFGNGARESVTASDILGGNMFHDLLSDNSASTLRRLTQGVSRLSPTLTGFYGLGVVITWSDLVRVSDPLANCCWRDVDGSDQVGSWLIQRNGTVPEPSAFILMSAGLTGLFCRYRRMAL